MSETKVVKIDKIGHTPPAGPPPVVKGGAKSHKRPAEKKPKFGVLKGGKTARNKPRFEGVADPAKSPPLKKSNKLRILTEKGAKTRRAKIVEDSQKMPISKIKHTLRASGLPVREHAPDKLVRTIYEDAREAGMLSPA